MKMDMPKLFASLRGRDSQLNTPEGGIRITRGFCCVRVVLLSPLGVLGKDDEETSDDVQFSRQLL